MSASNTFLVGQCTRVRDNVFMKARAQSVDGVMRDLTHTAQAEFPPEGEIELRGARAFLKQDDWVIAKPVLDGPPRRQRWVSPTARKLLPFEDLSGMTGSEAARRLLVETGLQDNFVGEKIYRIGADEMIMVKMVKSDDGRTRATAADMARLPVYAFDPAKILAIPTPGGSISLMEKNHQSPETRLANWMSDAQYVEQIVRSALAGDDDEQKARAAIGATLLAHAGRLGSLLSGAGEPDPEVLQEISRSRRLGEIVTSRPALVADFMQVLQRDPSIRARIDEEIARLTSGAVEAKRVALTAELTASMEAEFAAVRRERGAKLEAELRDLETSSLQELQARLDAQQDTALSSLEMKRSSLERAVEELQNSRDALLDENRAKAGEIDAINADITRLSLEAVDRKEDVDRLLRMEQVLRKVGDRASAPTAGPLMPLTSPSPSARPLAVGEISDWLKESHLLTDAGRRGAARVAALILSGGVPVVDGPEADDVLDVLASMLAAGVVTAFDCDPTVISYEDLWRRPGSGEPTAIGQALSDVRKTSTVRLCAIRRADLAPAQFWIDTLRRAGKQKSFPNGFLLCVTRGGEDESETAGSPLSFRAEGWLERNAGAAAVASLADESFLRFVDASGVAADQSAALALIGSARVSITNAKWLAGFAPTAKAILKGDAGAFLKEVLDSFSADAKPKHLKLIDNGGPSRA
ncbi:hypothetical protein SSBR45G_14330 [Bradyrhizobium sp. SSBR45G]|uniref:hypothetical protein n=1 Tax=unclassified Bradyrhizobium TaxID=2631580 RepID=UPI002342B079|nr:MULTISPECIES: hypothetical protein [unclassified Bradyrhizobium]GLH76525.1 hypothetical protein SSBR45G_14330 [Bradyrhizobium sp. SSBR45G]GLH84142.1 hypothetical protein SSBR45R_16020 [Bradyrhizobium sp. SSBR45R]